MTASTTASYSYLENYLWSIINDGCRILTIIKKCISIKLFKHIFSVLLTPNLVLTHCKVKFLFTEHNQLLSLSMALFNSI